MKLRDDRESGQWNWVIYSISSTLGPSMRPTDICKTPTKLLLLVYRDCCEGDLSTHLANLPTTLQQQSRLYCAESFKA